MRSTKYDKKGSLYEDMIKPLELWLYNSIRYHEKKIRRRIDKKQPHLKNICYDSKELRELADLRKIVEVTAETVIRLAMSRDIHIVKQPEGLICGRVTFGNPADSKDYSDFYFNFSDGTCINLSLTECSTVDCKGKPIDHPLWSSVVQGRMAPKDFVNALQANIQEQKNEPIILEYHGDDLKERFKWDVLKSWAQKSESAYPRTIPTPLIGTTTGFRPAPSAQDDDNCNEKISWVNTSLFDEMGLDKTEYDSIISDILNVFNPLLEQKQENKPSIKELTEEWSEEPDYMGEDTLEKDKPIDKNEWKDRLPSCEIKLHKPAPTSEIDRDHETDLLFETLSQIGIFFIHSGGKTWWVNTGEERAYWCEISDEVRVPIPFGVLYAAIKFIREKGSIHEHPPTVEVLDDWVTAVHRDLVSKPYIDLNKIKWAPNGDGTFSTGTMDLKFVYFMASKCYGVTGW